MRSAHQQGAPTHSDPHRHLNGDDRSAEIRARNSRILTEVLQSSRSVLVYQARKHAQLPEDADEALQGACILFIERFDPRYRPLPWLQTTVKREAWRIAKRAWRRRESSFADAPRADGEGTVDLEDIIVDPGEGLEEHAERTASHAEIVAMFEQLKPDERTALLMLGLGCSYAEIGALRGWTHTKVNRCLSEGRAALRRCLGVAENG